MMRYRVIYRSILMSVMAGLFLFGVTPAAQAAGTTTIVAISLTPSNCGSITTANTTDLAAAINNTTNGTVVVCPGTYGQSADIIVSAGRKVTIKRAITGIGSKPVLHVTSAFGILTGAASSLTIDGVIFDGSGYGSSSYKGLEIMQSSLTLKNSTVIGPNQPFSAGVYVSEAGAPKTQAVSITNSYIVGYESYGVYVEGPLKLTMSGDVMDGSDNGRVSGSPTGVGISGQTGDILTPAGTVTKCTVQNNALGINITGTSKVSLTNNFLTGNPSGILVATTGSRSANSITVSGNTISGIQSTGYGIQFQDTNLDTITMTGATISKNILVARQYTPSGVGPIGIEYVVNNGLSTKLTGTISGNQFLGLPSTEDLVTIPSHVKVTGNDSAP